MRKDRIPTFLLITALAVGCSDGSNEPEPIMSPLFAKGGAAACPTPADYIVNDESSLLGALHVVSPGEVIGLDGFFGVTADVFLLTDDVTLTCASAGSGLYAVANAGVFYVLEVLAADVTVEHLVLDGFNALGPLWAQNNGVSTFAQGLRLANNRVTCGTSVCAFLVGVADATIVDNDFESLQPLTTGVHIQGQGAEFDQCSRDRPTDGTVVRRNTITTTDPSTSFGGIRLRDGTNVVIEQNAVLGPWSNSIHASRICDSEIEKNKLEGAVWDGLLMWTDAYDNVIRNNKMTGAGEAGVLAGFACGNLFLGNNLNSNAQWGAFFLPETGNNTLVGDKNVVVDDGDWDCDGDGEVDPNIITGRVKSGVPLGRIISAAISSGKMN